MLELGKARVLAAAGIQKVAVSNLAQDFLGGMDPLGVWTNPYGREAERAGLSEGEHALKQTVSTGGGMVGGSLLVPSMIYGGVEGAKGLMSSRGGGLKKRLAHGASRFLEGAKAPIKSVTEGGKATQAARRVSQGGDTLTDQEIDAMRYLGQQAGITQSGIVEGVRGLRAPAAKKTRSMVGGALDNPERTLDSLAKGNPDIDSSDLDMVKGLSRAYLNSPEGGKLKGRLVSRSGEMVSEQIGDAANYLDNLTNDQIKELAATPEGRQILGRLSNTLESRLNTAKAQLGLGGLIGAGGAFYQYGSGRQTERETSPLGRLKRSLGMEV